MARITTPTARFVLFATAVAAATTACASVSTFGNSYARGCFEAAEQRRTSRDALRICDSALLNADLSANDRVATLVNRGIIQMQSRLFEAAIADYDAAIRVQPDIAEAWVNKGIALLRQGERDNEALAMLSEGIARGPQRPEIAYYTRGIAHEYLGHAREAFEDYSRAARLAPDWTEPAEQLERFQFVRRKTGSA